MSAAKIVGGSHVVERKRERQERSHESLSAVLSCCIAVHSAVRDGIALRRRLGSQRRRDPRSCGGPRRHSRCVAQRTALWREAGRQSRSRRRLNRAATLLRTHSTTTRRLRLEKIRAAAAAHPATKLHRTALNRSHHAIASSDCTDGLATASLILRGSKSRRRLNRPVRLRARSASSAAAPSPVCLALCAQASSPSPGLEAAWGGGLARLSA